MSLLSFWYFAAYFVNSFIYNLKKNKAAFNKQYIIFDYILPW